MLFNLKILNGLGVLYCCSLYVALNLYRMAPIKKTYNLTIAKVNIVLKREEFHDNKQST